MNVQIHLSFGSLLAFAFGLLLWPLLKATSNKLFEHGTAPAQSSFDKLSHVYSLKHGILNMTLPPSTMWMNMGYWKDQGSDPEDFSKACRALLRRAFRYAFAEEEFRLLPERTPAAEPAAVAPVVAPTRGPGAPRNAPQRAPAQVIPPVTAPEPPPQVGTPPQICLLDVGIGCGDQSLYLLPALASREEIKKDRYEHRMPLVMKYVGLTSDLKQYAYARNRLESSKLFHEMPAQKYRKHGTRNQIFWEDAAIPSQWSTETKKAVNNFHAYSAASRNPTWLLGLDCMYHFTPSRLPLLRYACKELEASFLAFDLILADDSSAPNAVQRLLLRIICLMTSMPFSNLRTQAEYTDDLKSAGYKAENVKIHDVSKWVFKPLSEFLFRQDSHLQSLGMSIGAFRVAKWMFAWWARTGIIKGCVIVAKQKVNED